MSSTFRNGFWAGLLVAFLLGLWLVRLWAAENQVRLHSEHLVHQVERRNWNAVGEFIAPEYRDDWGHDRAQLLNRLRFVGRFFFDLTITTSAERIQVRVPEGAWQAQIHLEGRGEAAGEITARVNRLTTPFVLRWERASGKPWDWKLVKVTNETLEIPRGEF